MKITKGYPIVYHSIFIKEISSKTDIELLEYLHLGKAEQVEIDHYWAEKFRICIYKNDDWFHIMDNLFYALDVSNILSHRIKNLIEHHEVFIYNVGDTDRSFHFQYFKEGVKKREYKIVSPNFNDEILHTDFGTPFPSEEKVLLYEDRLDTVTHIAKSLGIIFPQNLEDIRCYQLEESIFEGDVL